METTKKSYNISTCCFHANHILSLWKNLFHILSVFFEERIGWIIWSWTEVATSIASVCVQKAKTANKKKQKKTIRQWCRSLSLDSVWCNERRKNTIICQWQPVWFVLRARIFSCNFHVCIFPRPNNRSHSANAYKIHICV